MIYFRRIVTTGIALSSFVACLMQASATHESDKNMQGILPAINWRFEDAIMRLETQDQFKESMRVFTKSEQLLHLFNLRKNDFSEETYNFFLKRFICGDEIVDQETVLNRQKKFKNYQELLFTFCAEGNVQGIPKLIDLGVDINAVDEDGNAPLHIAIANRDTDMLRTLKSHGANILLRDEAEGTLLHYATVGGDIDVVRFLVEECDLNITEPDNENITPLHLAASMGYHDVVQYVIEHSGGSVDPIDLNGMTPLHHAALEGNASVVWDLIKKYSANSLARDNAGMTAMHFAIKGGSLGTLRALFRLNQDLIIMRDNEGKTPLDGTDSTFKVPFVLGRISARAKGLVNDPTRSATTSEDTCLMCSLHPRFDFAECEELDALCCSHCSANVVHNPAWTPLHVVAALGQMPIARRLIEHHPEYGTIPDAKGAVALHWAARGGQAAMVALLLEHFPETVRSRDVKGTSPLKCATSYPRTVIPVFLEKMRDWAQLHLQKPEVISRLSGNCLICLHAPENPRALSCCLGGVYCADCIACHQTSDKSCCPICREISLPAMLLDVPLSVS